MFTLLERVDSKLDKVSDRLDKVDVHLAKYNKELEFHIARTNQIEDTLVPIATHVEQVKGALKLAGVVGSILLIAATIYGVFK